MTVTIKLTETQHDRIISMVLDHLKMADDEERPQLEELFRAVTKLHVGCEREA